MSSSLLRLAHRRAQLRYARQVRRGLATSRPGSGAGKKLAVGATIAVAGGCAAAVAMSQADDAFRANLEQQAPFAKPLLDATIGPRRPEGKQPAAPRPAAQRAGPPRLDEVVDTEPSPADVRSPVQEAAHEAVEKVAAAAHALEQKASELLENVHLPDTSVVESVKKAVEKGEEMAANALEHGKEVLVRAETLAEELVDDVRRAVTDLYSNDDKTAEAVKEQLHDAAEAAAEKIDEAISHGREKEAELKEDIAAAKEAVAEHAEAASMHAQETVQNAHDVVEDAVVEVSHMVADAAGEVAQLTSGEVKEVAERAADDAQAVEVTADAIETTKDAREQLEHAGDVIAEATEVTPAAVVEVVSNAAEAAAQPVGEAAVEPVKASIEVAESIQDAVVDVAETVSEQAEATAAHIEAAMQEAREQVEEAAESLIAESQHAEEEARRAAMSAESALRDSVQETVAAVLPPVEEEQVTPETMAKRVTEIPAAGEALSNAAFDVDDLWKRFDAKGDVPEGVFEQLQAKVQFLVDEARRLSHLLQDTEHRAEETLGLAIRDTEAAVKEQMGRELAEIKRRAHEAVEAERHLTQQKLEELKEVLAAQHNEELLRAQRRLEELHELYYREKLVKQGEKQFEAGKMAYLMRLNHERAQRLAVLETLVAKLKEVEGLLNERVRNTNGLQQVNRLGVAKAAIESAFKSGQPLTLDREALTGLEADPLVKLAVDALPESFFTKGTASFGTLQARFRSVRAEARKAAYLPADGGGFLAHARASLMATLTFERAPSAKPVLAEEKEGEVMSAPQEADQTLARAEFWLARGDLKKATQEVNQLRGWARKAAQAWLEDARARLEVEQSLRLLDAHTALASVAGSP